MKVAITTHVFATGPGQDLRDYLNNKQIDELIFIGHPLFYSSRINGSSYFIYREGKLIKSKVTKNPNIPLLLNFAHSFVLSFFWSLRFIKDYDLYVGCNNLNTLVGLILKKMGRVKKCVYYVIDYNPIRFPNRFINFLYHKSDQFCVRHCDETWNLSPRMIEGRKKCFGFDGGNQKVVPIGVWFDRIPRRDFNDIERYTAVFVGHLLEKQGIQHVIRALPQIIKQIPDFRFEIFGDGPYKPKLQELVNELGLNHIINFRGHIESHEELENTISKYALAFALYNMREENGTLSFTYFADPAKLKLYMACGLPVFITDVAYNAKDIEKEGCGIIVSNDFEVISQNVISLLSDSDRLSNMRDNAIRYASKYNWLAIFEKLL